MRLGYSSSTSLLPSSSPLSSSCAFLTEQALLHSPGLLLSHPRSLSHRSFSTLRSLQQAECNESRAVVRWSRESSCVLFVSTFILQIPEKRYPESSAQVYSKVPVISQLILGSGLLTVPFIFSLLYKAFGFTTSTDIMWAVLGLSASAFLLHSIFHIKKDENPVQTETPSRTGGMQVEEESEESLLLKP